MMNGMIAGKWLVLGGAIPVLGVVLAGMWWLGDAVRSDRPTAVGREQTSVDATSGETGESTSPTQPRREARAAGREDPAIRQALALLEGMGEDEVSGGLEKLAAGWAPEKLEEAVIALSSREQSSVLQASLRDVLLQRWARAGQGGGAPDWVAGLAADGGGGQEASLVALAWAQNDPDAAWRWAESLPAGEARDAAQLSLLYEWSREGAAAALERLPTTAVGAEWDQFVEHAVANWASEAPEAALAWVRGLSDPVRRDRALGSLATAWAESDPVAAATLAAAAMDEGPRQERAVAAVVQRWAQQDPAAARAWVETFPDGPLKEDAFRLIEEQTPAPEEDGEGNELPPTE